MQGQGQGQAQGQGQESQGSLWQARQAVLTLLACYLRTSPIVQRTAVLKWNVVAALFSLLWEERTQQPALDMVCCAVLCCLSVCVCLSVCMSVCMSVCLCACLCVCLRHIMAVICQLTLLAVTLNQPLCIYILGTETCCCVTAHSRSCFCLSVCLDILVFACC